MKTPNVCGCKPTTCAAAGASCGTIPDGCGGTLDCGNCSPQQACSTSNQCVCTGPLTACPAGDTCGTVPDGCGGTVECGNTCAGPQQSCIGGKCVCIPQTAATACGTNNCGTAPDGCGGTVNCGPNGGVDCVSPFVCAIPAGQTAGSCLDNTMLCDPTNPVATTQTCFASRDKPSSPPSTKCSICTMANGCYDPNLQGGTCEMLTTNASLLAGPLPDGTTCAQAFAPLTAPSERAVCLDVLNTVFQSGCAATLQETPCLCGGTDVTQCLAGTAPPTGAAYDEYACDFGGANGALINTVETSFLVPTYGAGEANQLIQCAAAFGCDCF